MKKIFNLYASGYTAKDRKLVNYIFVEECDDLSIKSNLKRINEIKAIFMAGHLIDPETITMIYTSSDKSAMFIGDDEYAVYNNTSNYQIMKLNFGYNKESRYLIIPETFTQDNPKCPMGIRFTHCEYLNNNDNVKLQFYNDVVTMLMQDMYEHSTGHVSNEDIKYEDVKNKLMISYCYADPNNNSHDIDDLICYNNILPCNHKPKNPTMLEKFIGFFYDSKK